MTKKNFKNEYEEEGFWLGNKMYQGFCVVYLARSSYQSLRTYTIWMEKARTFYMFPFHWCNFFKCWVVAVIKLFYNLYNEFKTTKCCTKTSLLSLPILFALSNPKYFNTWQMLLGVWVCLELTEPLWWQCNHLSQQWKL